MNLLTKVLSGVVAVMVASIAWASGYKNLVAKGYRWVAIDGPYACPTKDDLREITGDQSQSNRLHLVEELRAYFLIKGALVKVIQDDSSAGMVQICGAGFTSDLWTYNRFLSKHPIRDAFAVIETPETSGLLPGNISSQKRTVQSARSSVKIDSTNRRTQIPDSRFE
jgi:hypothetical protein